MSKHLHLAPGLGITAIAVALSLVANSFMPVLSALLVAILLGVLAGNLGLPASTTSGLAFAAKPLLRAGIVLLGLQLAVGEILDLGPGMIIVVVTVVGFGMLSTYWLGRRLGMSDDLATLMASGFSICGAAAVAAAGSAQDADEEEVATALAMVVVFGTVMIPVLPLLARLAGLSNLTTGLWAGSAVHEVAQVVAIGGSLGAVALNAAVVVKLARVLMLAPMIALLSWRRRRRTTTGQGTLPPVVPLWVALFLLMVVVRSLGVVPEVVLSPIKWLQTALLAAAMFALGTGVKMSIFREVGGRPLLLGALSTAIVTLIGLGGVLVMG